jgi:hypothetical protein
VKLRPERFGQNLDFALGQLQQERRQVQERWRKEQRKHGENRITAVQMDEADAVYDREMADIQRKEDRLFEAEDKLRGAGRMK